MKKAHSLVLALMLAVAGASGVHACYGAAALGMGGAYTSLATGALAVYWNQAGLAFTPARGEVSFTETTPLDVLNYNSFTGVAVKVTDRLGLGFGHTQLAPEYGNERWNTFAAGLKLTGELAIGGAFRLVDGEDPNSGSYYASEGFDLSAQYRKEIATGTLLNLGVLVQDVGGPSAANPYLQNVRPALSLETDRLTLAFDLYDAGELRYAMAGELNYLDHQVGVEYRPWGKAGGLALRGGVYHERWGNFAWPILTWGAGLQRGGYFVDFVSIPEWGAAQATAGIRF